jgi:hypothetical protein
VNVSGRCFGFRAYRASAQQNAFVAILVDTSGPAVVSAKSFFEVASLSGWQQAWCRPVVRLTPSHDYRLFVMFPEGRYSRTVGGFGSPVTHGHISLSGGFASTNVIAWTLVPSATVNANGVDILFLPD